MGNDGGGDFRVQEAVPENVPDDFVGAAVVGFGAAALTLEGGGPAGLEAGFVWLYLLRHMGGSGSHGPWKETAGV
ncbi:MAG: hypothetical protein NTW03_23175 [Verrucomicrobia bacterium]|nr:hypothetical protein [Verrucomicrobiota bacterium]